VRAIGRGYCGAWGPDGKGGWYAVRSCYPLGALGNPPHSEIEFETFCCEADAERFATAKVRGEDGAT